MRPMTQIPVILTLVLSTTWVGPAATVAPPQGSLPQVSPEAGWRRAAIWDDGKAEFNAYAVSWSHYRGSYPGKALLVVVKEPWNPALDVKADHAGAESFDVLKLNHIRDVRTGIYEYHQMASVFIRRDTGRLQKLAVTSTEACGMSTADMTRGQLRTRSYFDGQGNRTSPWPQGALAEDSLALQLRDLVVGQAPATLQIFPSLMTGRYPKLSPVTYALERKPAGQVTVPAGSFQAVALTLKAKKRSLTYTFEEAVPHRLLMLETSSGTTYKLMKSERIPYWSMNRPEGADWMPAGLR